MSFEDKGKFISLLCIMHQKGRLPEETIRLLVGSPSVTLRSKFNVDEHGLWYNTRLELEIEKRNRFVGSRRKNGENGGRPKANAEATKNLSDTGRLLKQEPTHIHTENENENKDMSGDLERIGGEGERKERIMTGSPSMRKALKEAMEKAAKAIALRNPDGPFEHKLPADGNNPFWNSNPEDYKGNPGGMYEELKTEPVTKLSPP